MNRGPCLVRDDPNGMRSAEQWGGGAFTVADWGAGCGSVHFPPNAVSQYDYYSETPAHATCEHYGLGDGPDGGDLQTRYARSNAVGYEPDHGDCGGGWMVYMGQSMPGLDNDAIDVAGAPMMNWWPFLFY